MKNESNNSGLKFEFAKYTEVTDLAFSINPEYQANGYTRVFICPDTHDFHLARVLPGFNREYERDPNRVLFEINEIPRLRGSKIRLAQIRRILIDDTFDNYDVVEYPDVETLIDESIDQGFGVHNLKTAAADEIQ